jgi:hypothetical protein
MGGATVANGRTVTGDTEIHPLLDNDEEEKGFTELADILRDIANAPSDAPVSITFEDGESYTKFDITGKNTELGTRKEK